MHLTPLRSLALFVAVSLAPGLVSAQDGEAEVVVGRDRAYAIFPDGRVAQRLAPERDWTPLPPLALCAEVRRLRGPAPLATVTSDGTLWVAHGSCLSRYRGGRWISERVSTGGLHTLASAADEVVVIVTSTDVRGNAVTTSRRSLHGSGRGWRIYELPSLREGEQHDLVRLSARGPDDVVIVGSTTSPRDAGLMIDRTLRFDGRRWRSARAIQETARDAVELTDGRLFVLSEDSSLHVGWPGGQWTRQPFPEGGRVARIEGTPDEFWAALFAGTPSRPQPGGLQRWRGGSMVEQVAFPARGARRFGDELLAWDRVGVYEVRGGRAAPIALGTPAAAGWPSASQASGLNLAPIQPAFVSRRSDLRVPATFTTRAVSIELGGSRLALVATPADVEGQDCPVEHQFSLVRLDGDRVVARQPLGPPSCGETSPLVDASLEAVDVDADGRLEVLARFPAQARDLDLAMLAIVDPEGLRVEGALVTDAHARFYVRDAYVSTRLYLDWSIDPAGQTLTRGAAAWNRSGARTRAPRLAPCRRDPARDAWECPGESLETAVARAGSLRSLPLPASAPRTP